MDDRTASDHKILTGHSGPIFATSFSPDRNLMVSSSEDGTSTISFLDTLIKNIPFYTNIATVYWAKHPEWSLAIVFFL